MFSQLKLQLHSRFNKLAQGELFYVNVDREKIWELYLAGFPEDERQSHNCNCCKSFLRQWAGIVSTTIGHDKISVWDLISVEGYEQSINNIADYIHSLPITDVFLNEFASCGTDKNFDGKREVIWEHFHITLPSKFVNKRNIDSVRGEKRTDKEVFHRALNEITLDAVDTVLELIAQNSLYKGKEYESLIKHFRVAKLQYEDVPTNNKDNFAWYNSLKVSQAVCRIKNSSIGQLLGNLSEGMDLDTTVGKFEQMVAPTNYKRPTALVTPKMVEQAKEKLEQMGLTDSLERRFANEADLNVSDILYIDKKSSITGDVFDDLSKNSPVNPRTFSKTEEITIKDFIEKVLPGSKEIEVLLENKHLPNMVSLLTGASTAKSLFKWDNLFSWSYTGGITDSIKERVKAAGGNVDGVLRVSLSWHNYDDLDLHIIEPDGNRIYFSDKKSHLTGGQLDVDMNAGGGNTREAVENIVWTDERKIPNGNCKIIVNNYSKREAIDAGYEIQVEYRGEIFNYSCRTSPTNGANHTVNEFKLNADGTITFREPMEGSVTSKEKWGIKTNVFHKVKQFMLSPNYWEKQTGNKHFMFFLENCINDESPRPFFNEFLKEEFTENRKVFEILGSKIKVEPTTNQLSGIGFSETNRNDLIVKVKGQFIRTLKIIF